MRSYLVLLLFGLIAASANIAGGYLISAQKSLDRALLKLLIASGAGFMLAATLLNVIPESFELSAYAPLVILSGYLFVQFAEHTVATHFHFGEETHAEPIISPLSSYTALTGLVLHSFFDGVLIASGFLLSYKLGFLLFFAIILHKIPEGFTAASIMRASDRSQRAVRFAIQLIALSTFAGVLCTSLFQRLLKYALPFSAGVTLYVAASDLIPEVNKEKGVAVSGVVFVGVLLYFVTDLLLSHLGL